MALGKVRSSSPPPALQWLCLRRQTDERRLDYVVIGIFAFATKPFPIVCRARAVGKMSRSCADFTRRNVWLGRESYRWFPPRRLTQSASPSNPPLVAEKSKKSPTRKVRAAALGLV